MKVSATTNTIERSGVKSEGEFTIRANAQAFKILSDGLYSDKELAILRELSCNAYDAHVDANNLDKPFEIQMPTDFDPSFKIRDFGTGMSKADMETVYRTYFESTKTDSNDKIGCLGLGSKSPFAYTDSFITTSYFNGMQYMYNAHLNESGTPALALMSESSTKEPNGLEVSFTVERNDWPKFTHRIQPCFRYFKVMPKITGTNNQPKPISYQLQGDKWGVRNEVYGDTMAVMGNVAYPIRNMNMDDMTVEERKMLSGVGLDLFFDIGDLDVQPSREGLQFNKRTVTAIRDRLAIVIEEVRKDAKKQIADCKTLWEARIQATKVSAGEYSSFHFLFNGHDIFEWGGESLSTEGKVYLDNKKLLLEDGKDADTSMSVLRFSHETSYRSLSGYTNKKDYVHNIVASESNEVYFNDINKGQHIRCKQQSAEEGVDYVYLLTCSEKVKKAVEAKLGRSIPSVDNIKVVKDKVQRQGIVSVNNPKNAKKILAFDPNESSWRDKSACWKSEDVDIKDGGIYVVIDRYKVTGGISYGCLNDDRGSEVNRIYSNLFNTMGADMPKFYGIKPAMMDKEKIADKSNWITLQEYFEAELEKFLKVKSNRKIILEGTEWESFKNSIRYENELMTNLDLIQQKNVEVKGEIAEFIKIIKAMNSSQQSWTNLKQLCAWGKVEVDDEFKKGLETTDFKGKYKALIEKYFMLAEVRLYGLDDKKIKKYIDMTDAFEKNGKNG